MSLTKMATSLSVIHQEVAISSEAETNYKVCTCASCSVHMHLQSYSMYVHIYSTCSSNVHTYVLCMYIMFNIMFRKDTQEISYYGTPLASPSIPYKKTFLKEI